MDIGEIIFACPSCYYFLKDRLPFKSVTIYEKLTKLGFTEKLGGKQGVYIPCPDRKEKIFYSDASKLSEEGFVTAFSKLQCCGGGGNVKKHDMELALSLAKKINVKFYGRGKLYTICPSCKINFKKAGKNDSIYILEELFNKYRKFEKTTNKW